MALCVCHKPSLHSNRLSNLLKLSAPVVQPLKEQDRLLIQTQHSLACWVDQDMANHSIEAMEETSKGLKICQLP
jgi:hypothetical protein